jgi:hypothetical protein
MQVQIAETLKNLTKKAPKTPKNIQPRMSLAVCWPKGSTLQYNTIQYNSSSSFRSYYPTVGGWGIIFFKE